MKRLLSLITLVFLAGCATMPYPPGEVEKISTPGIYHEVGRGQTLWHISRIYDIKIEDIIKANRLPDASKIEVDQLIFIPEAREDATYDTSKKSQSFIWPARGTVVSYFGSMKNMAKNKGIDMETREGANVLASRSGKVTFASDRLKGYGKTIIIDHLDGFETVYAHNRNNLVKVGQRVNKGDVIAKSGKTGRAKRSTLHFEIRRKHRPQNPFYYLP